MKKWEFPIYQDYFCIDTLKVSPVGENMMYSLNTYRSNIPNSFQISMCFHLESLSCPATLQRSKKLSTQDSSTISCIVKLISSFRDMFEKKWYKV